MGAPPNINRVGIDQPLQVPITHIPDAAAPSLGAVGFSVEARFWLSRRAHRPIAFSLGSSIAVAPHRHNAWSRRVPHRHRVVAHLAAASLSPSPSLNPSRIVVTHRSQA
ncbi:hypothetical protein MPL3365_170303 [Mesorhizobium plurifarium]|uniref:Uncharacterized protein n=1 Tax=Mesorhizobium plurifarium TaxID=69974 RepID=A0A090FZG6_MESPL|nr:hypothetical protein MPL3365_170303 [Mesorhizobium plurifarium]